MRSGTRVVQTKTGPRRSTIGSVASMLRHKVVEEPNFRDTEVALSNGQTFAVPSRSRKASKCAGSALLMWISVPGIGVRGRPRASTAGVIYISTR